AQRRRIRHRRLRTGGFLRQIAAIQPTHAPKEANMRVGVPCEIKPGEHRVGLTPTAVREYVARGHEVLVEAGAGVGAGYPDEAYHRAGARIVPDAAAVFGEARLIVKVKEPQAEEWASLTPDHILFA